MMLRKKELSALPELIGGAEDGISAVAEIVEIGGAEILHIDVSEFGKMLVRYFADKKAGRWICFGKNSGWNQMGLYSAIDFELSRGDYEYYGGGGYRYYRVQAKPNFDALSSELVDRYFDGSKYWRTGTEWLITEWEQEIRGDKRERQMSNKMYRIKQIMDRVPALPDDFEDWLKHVDRIVQKYGSHSLYLMFPEMSMDQANKLLAYADAHWSDVKGTFCVEHGLR